MAKRSTGQFIRHARDLYLTPAEAVAPLIPHLDRSVPYVEPCAADGTLVRHLLAHNVYCERASDIYPLAPWIAMENALETAYPARLFITNPPWDRDLLHGLIVRLSNIAPTWLLFDADWGHTVQEKLPTQANDLMWDRCVKKVAVGRVKWIPGSKYTGKDNVCWYLFDARKAPGPTLFFPIDRAS